MKCPFCQGENVARCSVIYQSGTYMGSDTIKTKGLNLHYGNSIILPDGYSKSQSTSTINHLNQSLLAIKCSPPEKDNEKSAALIFGLLCPLSLLLWRIDSPAGFLTIVVTLISLGKGIFDLYGRYIFNRDIWPDLYAKWLKRNYCYSCDRVFNEE